MTIINFFFYFFYKIFSYLNKKQYNICFYVLLSLLSGCGEYSEITGISKSSAPYFVRDEWHHPQQHYEYDEEGLASWYGPGFHGKPKPYGEPFDQNALTAAHKTLPLPSVVRVTNLENDRSVIVVIDDRGPFVYENRIIDLSVASAKAIGIYEKGVGKVRVECIAEESNRLSNYLTRYGKSGRDPSGRTWVQIYHQEIKPHQEFCTEFYDKKVPISSSSSSQKIRYIENKSQPNREKQLKSLLSNLEPQSHKKQIRDKQFYIELNRIFVQKNNADSFAYSFSKKYPSIVKRVKHASGELFYQVYLGPFKNQFHAKCMLENVLIHANFSAKVVYF